MGRARWELQGCQAELLEAWGGGNHSRGLGPRQVPASLVYFLSLCFIFLGPTGHRHDGIFYSP